MKSIKIKKENNLYCIQGYNEKTKKVINMFTGESLKSCMDFMRLRIIKNIITCSKYPKQYKDSITYLFSKLFGSCTRKKKKAIKNTFEKLDDNYFLKTIPFEFYKTKYGYYLICKYYIFKFTLYVGDNGEIRRKRRNEPIEKLIIDSDILKAELYI